MFERALNVFWIVLGAGAAAYAWTLGIVGPSGPESGLFPFLAGAIVAATGVALLVMRSSFIAAPDWPRGAALVRVLGVVAGLAVMAAGVKYLGFAVAGFITMLMLLRTVERASWLESLALAIGSIVIVEWLFGHVLGMVLPRGPWGW